MHLRLSHAAYHSEEAERFLAEVVSNERDLLYHVLRQAASGVEEREFTEAQAKAEAHTLACAQALHATGDMIAHVVFFTALSTGDIPEDSRGLGTVTKKLKEKSEHSTDLIPLLRSLQHLQNGEAFSYLTAFVNVSKHRYILETRGSAHLVFPKRFGIRVDSFSYKGRDYQRRWADTITESYLGQIRRRVIEIHKAVDAWLQ